MCSKTVCLQTGSHDAPAHCDRAAGGPGGAGGAAGGRGDDALPTGAALNQTYVVIYKCSFLPPPPLILPSPRF